MQKDAEQMDNVSQICEIKIRKATKNDISILASHHRKMFEEIWERKGEHLGTVRADEIEKAYAQKMTVM